MRILLTLGGHGLSSRSTRGFAERRIEAGDAAGRLASALRAHEVIITHGHGLLSHWALEPAGDSHTVGNPFEVFTETVGVLDYTFQTEVGRVLGGDLVTVLTRIIVDPEDPAFDWPNKPIGPVYRDIEAAQLLAYERGWTLIPEDDGVRRVVVSPEPRGVVEAAVIERLVEQGVSVICVGGGIPVTADLAPLGAVDVSIDEDLASGLLASMVGADRFVSLTDVEAVFDGWGTRHPRPITHSHPSELRRRRFEGRSIGPKVEAACRFVEATGGTAAIGSVVNAARVIEGSSGTQIGQTNDSSVAYGGAAAGTIV